MLYLTCSLGQLIGPSTSSGGIAQTKLDVSSRNPPRCRNDSSTAKRPARLMTHIMFGTLVNYHISSPSKRTLRTVPRRDKARGAAAKVGRLPAGSLFFPSKRNAPAIKANMADDFPPCFFFLGFGSFHGIAMAPLGQAFHAIERQKKKSCGGGEARRGAGAKDDPRSGRRRSSSSRASLLSIPAATSCLLACVLAYLHHARTSPDRETPARRWNPSSRMYFMRGGMICGA